MANNYFFVDGSSLLADIGRLQLKAEYQGRKFDLAAMTRFFCGPALTKYHSGSYRRFVFYFVQNDPRERALLVLPDHTMPGVIEDLRLERCGKRLGRNAKAAKWLDEKEAPDYVRDSLYRSEKAVDTQICCDALQLAATGKLDRLFLYTNDLDFVPLCSTLRRLGVNINLIRLVADKVNKDLVRECDAFDVVPQGDLDACFVAARS